MVQRDILPEDMKAIPLVASRLSATHVLSSVDIICSTCNLVLKTLWCVVAVEQLLICTGTPHTAVPYA
jgi:hypothetical protein